MTDYALTGQNKYLRNWWFHIQGQIYDFTACSLLPQAEDKLMLQDFKSEDFFFFIFPIIIHQ